MLSDEQIVVLERASCTLFSVGTKARKLGEVRASREAFALYDALSVYVNEEIGLLELEEKDALTARVLATFLLALFDRPSRPAPVLGRL